MDSVVMRPAGRGASAASCWLAGSDGLSARSSVAGSECSIRRFHESSKPIPSARRAAAFFLIVHQTDKQVAGFGHFVGGPAEFAAPIEHGHVEHDAVEMAAGGLGGQDMLDAQIGFLESGDGRRAGQGALRGSPEPASEGASPGRRCRLGIMLADVRCPAVVGEVGLALRSVDFPACPERSSRVPG